MNLIEPKKTEKADLEKKKGIFFQLGLVIVMALVLIAFEWTSKPDRVSELLDTREVDIEEEIVPITREELEPPPPPPPPQVLDELVIVEDDVEIEDELIIEDMDMEQHTMFEIVDHGDEESAEEEIFFIVEDMPSFRGGGLEGFRNWVQSNLRYPEIAAENGISGRVFVQFAVNARGEVEDVQVVRGVDPALDAEAVRVVRTSPSWSPGKQRGRPVKVQFTFPIVFVLQ